MSSRNERKVTRRERSASSSDGYSGNEKKDRSRDRSDRIQRRGHTEKRSSTPKPRPHKQWFTVDRFDGSTPWLPFAERFRFCAKMNGWDELEKAAQLQSSLKGMAAQILCYGKRREWTFAELFEKLEDRFGSEDRADEFLAKLETRTRGPKETIQHLCHGIEELVALAYPGPRTTHSDRFAVSAFLRALDDAELAGKIRDKRPPTLDDASKLAQMYESFECANTCGRRKRPRRPPGDGCR